MHRSAMKKKLSKLSSEQWWNDILEFERTHEIAFASPRALVEARLIEALDKARRQRRRATHNVTARRRPAAAGTAAHSK
jgi:hypothetical protein